MLDLIIKRCTLPDGRQDIDIGIAQGRIAALEPALKAEARAPSTRPASWCRRPSWTRTSTWTRRCPSGCRA